MPNDSIEKQKSLTGEWKSDQEPVPWLSLEDLEAKKTHLIQLLEEVDIRRKQALETLKKLDNVKMDFQKRKDESPANNVRLLETELKKKAKNSEKAYRYIEGSLQRLEMAFLYVEASLPIGPYEERTINEESNPILIELLGLSAPSAKASSQMAKKHPLKREK